MRQRKIKNLDEKLASFQALWTEKPSEHKGRWREWIRPKQPAAPLYVEIGCGKGQFLTRSAVRRPDAAFLAFEGHQSVALHALEKIDAAGLTNAKLVLQYLNDLTDIFEDEEIDGIYLNFSDPWPKDRHAKRRLTCGTRLAAYAKAMKPNAVLEFKTDNEGLFSYSLEEFSASDVFDVVTVTHDLHADVPAEELITTEYEDKFSAGGKPIHFLRAVRR